MLPTIIFQQFYLEHVSYVKKTLFLWIVDALKSICTWRWCTDHDVYANFTVRHLLTLVLKQIVELYAENTHASFYVLLGSLSRRLKACQRIQVAQEYLLIHQALPRRRVRYALF